jgi:hypothetical protein
MQYMHYIYFFPMLCMHGHSIYLNYYYYYYYYAAAAAAAAAAATTTTTTTKKYSPKMCPGLTPRHLRMFKSRYY